MSGVPAALTVAAPTFLWGLLLALPVILLHLYHRRRVVVPFLPLLAEAVGPRRPGGGWRRLRDRLPLLLRLLALAALVLAVAGLAPAPVGPPPPALVVVVDAGPTTAAVESDGRARYVHGLERARRLIASRAWREVAVLEARRGPEVVVAPTDDRGAAGRRVARRLREVESGRRAPDSGGGDLEAAFRTARDVAALRAPAHVRVLTAREVSLPDERVEDVVVALEGVGTTRRDQGLVAFDLALTAEGRRARLRLTVQNDASETCRRDLVLEVGGEEAHRRTLELGPAGTEDLDLELEPPHGGGWLDVRLEGADAFPPNDAARAWLPPPLRPSVLVVHDGAVRPYTRAILEAMGDAIDVAASGTVRAVDLPRAKPRDVTIVDGVALPAGALRPGAWIFLAPLGPGLPFEVGAPVAEPLVWRSAPDHPLVADLDLGAAWVARGFPVSGEGLVSLAEADGATVLGEGVRGEVRYVVLGLDPEASDLPLRAAFPLLVQGSIRRLAALPVAPLAPWYPAGGALRVRLPLPGGPEAALTWPGGDARARLDPTAPAWRVPAGAAGPVDVRTPTWRGRTAFVDVDPERTVVPARAAAPPPAAVPAPRDPALRWRRALLLAALLLLLLDLALLVPRRASPRQT